MKSVQSERWRGRGRGVVGRGRNFERQGEFVFLSVLRLILLYFVCESVLLEYMYVHQVCTWCPWRLKDGWN